MDELIRRAQGVRQGAIVTPLLFEACINGDAERIYCAIEEGDNINPVVSHGVIDFRPWYIPHELH